MRTVNGKKAIENCSAVINELLVSVQVEVVNRENLAEEERKVQITGYNQLSYQVVPEVR